MQRTGQSYGSGKSTSGGISDIHISVWEGLTGLGRCIIEAGFTSPRVSLSRLRMVEGHLGQGRDKGKTVERYKMNDHCYILF